MDSTRPVVTCDSCPFSRGCPVFAEGRRACILGVWSVTAALSVLFIAAAGLAAASGLVGA